MCGWLPLLWLTGGSKAETLRCKRPLFQGQSRTNGQIPSPSASPESQIPAAFHLLGLLGWRGVSRVEQRFGARQGLGAKSRSPLHRGARRKQPRRKGGGRKRESTAALQFSASSPKCFPPAQDESPWPEHGRGLRDPPSSPLRPQAPRPGHRGGATSRGEGPPGSEPSARASGRSQGLCAPRQGGASKAEAPSGSSSGGGAWLPQCP